MNSETTTITDALQAAITDVKQQRFDMLEKSHAAAIAATVKYQAIMEQCADDRTREMLYEATAEMIANMGLNAAHKSRWQNSLLASYNQTCLHYCQVAEIVGIPATRLPKMQNSYEYEPAC